MFLSEWADGAGPPWLRDWKSTDALCFSLQISILLHFYSLSLCEGLPQLLPVVCCPLLQGQLLWQCFQMDPPALRRGEQDQRATEGFEGG